MPKPILTDLDFGTTARVINMQNPVNAQDGATKAYVDSLVEGLAWKDNVRVATQANISIASPGATIDGITMATNDRVLVRSQTTTTENGIYIWNGAATPLTRTLDASTYEELESAVVTVDEGTSAGATFRQSGVNGTIGSTAVTWTSFGTASPAASEASAGIAEIATQAETDTGTDDLRFVTPLKLATWSGRVRKFSQTFGDGSATAYTITHNLNSQDVHVTIRQATGTFDEVIAEVEMTGVNAITIRTNTAPALNSLRVFITN